MLHGQDAACAGISAGPASRGREDLELQSISIRAGTWALLAELRENTCSLHGRNCCLLEKKIINKIISCYDLHFAA